MSRRSIACVCLTALVVLMIPVLLPPAASAASCNVVQITSTPGDITVKVVVTISGACSATQTFYKCGAATDSYQFSACGKTHTVTTSSNWEDAVSDCSVIGYSAQ